MGGGRKNGFRYGEGLGGEVMGDGSSGGNECLKEEQVQWAQNRWKVLEARWSKEECELGAVGMGWDGLGSRGDGRRGEINRRKREWKRGSTVMGDKNSWDWCVRVFFRWNGRGAADGACLGMTGVNAEEELSIFGGIGEDEN
ncbi:unnamed protein product [Calypogeia fissa]